MWSSGCVLAELLLGNPLFVGEGPVEQVVAIVKLLGIPTKEELYAMIHDTTELQFADIARTPFEDVFGKDCPDAIDLLKKLLRFVPSERLSPLEVCCHPFFDELRDPNSRLPNGGYYNVFFFFWVILLTFLY